MHATLNSYRSDSRPNLKYVVRARNLDGKVTRKFFKSKSAAQTYVAKLRDLTVQAGSEAASMKSEELMEVLECRRMLAPYGQSLREAVTQHVARLEASLIGITLRKAVDTILDSRVRAGRSDRTIRDLQGRLKVLVEHFGEETPVSAISSADAESWLVGLCLSAQSRNNYHSAASSLFNYATKRGWVQSNPFAAIDKAIVWRQLPGIFTGAQVQMMLDSTKDAEIRLYVALGAYAGLRSESEIERLDWKNIHLARGIIDLTGELGKNARRRQVDILPALKPVLEAHRQIAGAVVPQGFSGLTRFRNWKKRLPFKWPFDGLRHSFGTYYLMASEDAGKTALQMGHGGSPSTLFKHYNKPGVTHREGLEFFGLNAKGKGSGQIVTAG